MGRKETAAVLTFFLIAACGEGATSRPEPTSGAGAEPWAAMSESPLSPRRSAHAFSIDGRFVVVGGTEAPACPFGADCVTPTEAPERDAAAYDPATGKWTELAEAPVPLGYSSSAVVDNKVYLLVGAYGSTHPSVRRAFLSYDFDRDEWTELTPPVDEPSLALAATDSTVIAYQLSQENGVIGDFVYDVTSDSWAELPADPLRKSFDRTMVWTGDGVVLFGIEHVPDPGSDGPSFYRAALLDDAGEWHRLADSEVIGWDPVWWYANGRLVNATLERADGGEVNNWGRFYPAGGMFDPAANEWSELPSAPKQGGPFTGFYAGGERGIASNNGWVLGPDDWKWYRLERPRGAPDAESAAAWVDGTLYVWGGVRFDGEAPGGEAKLMNEGWSWGLPAS